MWTTAKSNNTSEKVNSEEKRELASRWVVRAQAGESAETLARELKLPRAIAEILVCRGMGEVEQARAFLFPALENNCTIRG